MSSKNLNSGKNKYFSALMLSHRFSVALVNITLK